jgi:hypothetical protein
MNSAEMREMAQTNLREALELTSPNLTLTKRATGILAPITDTTTPSTRTPTSYAAYGVVLPKKPRRFEPGSTATGMAEQVLIAAAELPDGIAPEPNDLVTMSGGRQIVIGPVDTLRPDGVTPVLYTCDATGGR